MLLLVFVGNTLGAGTAGPTEAWHRTSATVTYKCIFNHELLIVAGQKNNSPEYIGSFIAKLQDTDVDAILCCPTMWRANVFPSKVDPTWKKYTPGQPVSKFKPYDYMMTYLHAGGDPVKDTLEACRKHGKDFLISYRMNDHHYVTDLEWPTHNAIWREHPEFWLGDSQTSPYSKADDVRLFNYARPEVREYYFAIIQELCANYDVDGVELDFQRFPKFFRAAELETGRSLMTSLVKRIRVLLDRLGKERAKHLRLCVRVPETLEKCAQAGLDVAGWDAAALVDMINVSSFYNHTLELGIEEFKAKISRARIYGEMNYVTTQNSKVSKFARRYTTPEIYRASALNLFHRGADGLSLFNYDYVPAEQRISMARHLKGITDLEYLRKMPKDYAIYPGFGTFPASNEKTFRLIVPDDVSKARFDRALLRVETRESCAKLQIGAWLNGQKLEACEHAETELFPPLAQNEGYPARENLKFYSVPLEALIRGANTIEIRNLEKSRGSCSFFAVELALYPNP